MSSNVLVTQVGNIIEHEVVKDEKPCPEPDPKPEPEKECCHKVFNITLHFH
jgi:hypothetical protein